MTDVMTWRHTWHGRTEARGRISVTCTITMLQADRRQTVRHEPAPWNVLRVSFRGEVIPYRCRLVVSAGQVIMSERDSMPRDLARAWDRWHLNDMRSHCAHQDAAVPWQECPPCTETGYRAGSAWLLEPPTTAGAVQCVQAVGGSAFVIGQDGIAVRVLSIDVNPLGVLHSLQGESAHYALRYGGWTVQTVTPDGVTDTFGDYGSDDA